MNSIQATPPNQFDSKRAVWIETSVRYTAYPERSQDGEPLGTMCLHSPYLATITTTLPEEPCPKPDTGPLLGVALLSPWQTTGQEIKGDETCGSVKIGLGAPLTTG